MTHENLIRLLTRFRHGDLSIDDTVGMLKKVPFQDLGFAKVDHHRGIRKGFPEVIWGQDKTGQQIAKITKEIASEGDYVLITRLEEEKAADVRRLVPELQYYAVARVGAVGTPAVPVADRSILVVTAGTADIRVAEEAAICGQWLGNKVERLFDVGVAGLHRLLDKLDELAKASVLIVVAGMEGALPSVVGGLVDRPVIAVPTSVGYGASFGGVTALLAMLNSCAAGVTVVNIDNGFGAAAAASLINHSSVGQK